MSLTSSSPNPQPLLNRLSRRLLARRVLVLRLPTALTKRNRRPKQLLIALRCPAPKSLILIQAMRLPIRTSLRHILHLPPSPLLRLSRDMRLMQPQHLKHRPREFDRVHEELGPVREHVGEGRVALEVCYEYRCGHGEEHALYWISSKHHCIHRQRATYERDIHMYTPISQKPMHERPLGRHHIRVCLRLHPRFLLGAQVWTGILWRLRPELGAVGWRNKFGRFLQHEGFAVGSLFGGSFGAGCFC
jgi:hypothetical protein